MKPGEPSLEYEIQVGYPGNAIAGVDEVGRGCIAGPVVAAAVVLPIQASIRGPIYKVKPSWLCEIKDSKLLTPVVREKLSPLIQEWALSYAVGVATVEEIDTINIFHASHLAMARAVAQLSVKPHHLLIDGKYLPQLEGLSATAIIGGDQKCLSIAAASIIAKVWRDQYMGELDRKYPKYGFARHKGYPTAVHAAALKKFGVSEVHRRSFKTVSTLL